MDEATGNGKEAPYKEGFYLGLILAITSCIFIGTSFIIKKISLLRTNINGVRAGAGGFGYLKDWLWWLGLIVMGLGEFLNFAAYLFAPASLVTPLGALSVLVSALLASRFLGEALSLIGKIGCTLCVLGAIVIVLHAPKEEEIESLTKLLQMSKNSLFFCYVTFVILLVFITIFYMGPRYGQRYVWIYVSLCSAIGSLTVMACKALGVAIKDAVHSNTTPETKWVIITLILCIALCISLQMNYLNRALDLFSTSVVTPVYYVMFTMLVLVASSMLLNEWSGMSVEDVLGSVCGFVITTIAIFLLSAQREGSGRENGEALSTQPLLRRGCKMTTHSI